MKFRIATWNLERPRPNGYAKNRARAEQLKEIAAQIFVLTETSAAVEMKGYAVAHAPAIMEYHRDQESAVSICTKTEFIAEIPTADPVLTICRAIQTPFGPLIAYGVVIPYAHFRGKCGTSKMWEEHRQSIRTIHTDLLNTREKFSNCHMLLAGDFNQTRSDTTIYADKTSVQLLTDLLDTCDLRCVTEYPRIIEGTKRVTVDHICLSSKLASQVVKVGAWEGQIDPGPRMSDHNGVYVDLNLS
jgi:exonuclease III